MKQDASAAAVPDAAPIDTYEVMRLGAIYMAPVSLDELARDGWQRGDADPDPRYGSVWFERRARG